METDDELEQLLLECFWARYPYLKPGVEYKAKRIFKPIWDALSNGDKRVAGNIFSKLVTTFNLPIECLGESKRTGHSQVYRIK
jgi:hypothetical protein